MRKSRWVERRVDEQYDLTLRRSFLFYVPKPSAYGFLGMGLVLAVIADVQAPPTVWLGPVYLFLIAFAAWTISGLLAVAIGLIVVTVTWAGGMDVYPYGHAYNLANMAIRFLCMLMIVLFLTIARRSCEKEWQMARIDPLTGALNRQAFFETIEASRHDEQWSALAYADLDGLKRRNDEQGHEEGDKAIKAFASRVKQTIRTGDVFARIGGDEFVVFMKIQTIDDGRKVAQRLHDATCHESLAGVGTLPCSWGVLLLPPGPRRIDQELKAADELMYRSKRARTGVGIARYMRNPL